MERLKKMYDTYFGKEKNMTNLAVILIIGVIILIAGGGLFKDRQNDNANVDVPVQKTTPANAKETKQSYGEVLEKKIEHILSQIEGVGKVSVMITFYSGGELVPAADHKSSETITEEKDTQGGNRKITQKEQDSRILTMNGQGSNEQPLVIKELRPPVKGVIVAAEGALDISVKEDIHEAVQTVLGVPAHKVRVFKKSK